MAQLRVEPSSGKLPLLTLDQIESGAARLVGTLNEAASSGWIRFEPGDVLFSKLRPYLAKSLLVDRPMHGTGELLAMTVGPELDAKFLLYTTLSQPWLDRADLTSYGTKMPRTSWQAMSDIQLPELAIDQQRRIADFLDDQVTRIDNIIAARIVQTRLIERLPWEQFAVDVAAAAKRWVLLRRVLSFIADGPFGSAFRSAEYVDVGPAVIRLGNIGFAEFRAGDLARISADVYGRFPRCHIEPGDLLIASLGDARNHAGRACAAPESLGPAMVKGKCFRAQVNRQRAGAQFLARLLSSAVGIESLERLGRGSTRTMLNIDVLMSAELPIPGLADQDAIMADFDRRSTDFHTAAGLVRQSVEGLGELKTSLITAAVTGEFDVSSADGSRVPV